uniref:Putative trypsin inhibitor like cysteine rich domain protein n=1 Tax=Rhipicephalus microplus TaxID=6941 RepID=A0A6G5A3X1_RHIMP
MARMNILSFAVIVVLCTFLLPATAIEPASEALTFRGGSGWHQPHWPNWHWPNWHWPGWPIWPRCRWGEVYKQCVSSSCGEKRCSDIGRPRAGCTRDCQSGCFCMNGLYRNRRGRCVFKWRCRRGGFIAPVPYGAE